LTRAVALVKNRETKIRWLFILAQLHQQKGEIKNAFDLYTKVIKMNPPYEMGFNARLNRARCSDATNGNNETVRKELEQMKSDPKNKDFLDQIYFALAGLAKNEGKEDEQLDLLNQSVRASTTNTVQKALSFLELGKIYFSKKNYKLAQAYYDSTTSNLGNDYPDYNEILNRRNSLTKLIKNLRVIDTEDSLQQLASLSPADLQRRVDEIVSNEQAAYEKEQEEKQSNQIFKPNLQESNQFNQASGSNWYFYNPQAISFGFNEFSKKFGDRKLEDDWRRSKKQVNIVSPDQLEVDSAQLPGKDKGTTAFNAEKRKQEILKSIPTDKEAIEKSRARVIEAYYNVGMIYREQLNDIEASAKAFESLVNKYPKNKYELQCYYQLYRSYLTLGNQTKSDYFKNIILNEHGETEYAEIIRNPNYANERANTKSKLEIFYEETYRKYLNGEYASVIQRKGEADVQFNKTPLTPKFDMLKTLSIGRTQPLPTFEASLNDIIRNYPDDSVSIQAQDILDVIHNAGKDNLKGEAPVNASNDSIHRVLNPFNYLPDTTHYVVLIFQNIGGALDGNKLKNKLSDFNSKNYAAKALQVRDVLLDHRNKMIIIDSFANRAQALEYFSTLYDNDDVFGNVSTDNYQQYCISVNNYPELLKQKNTVMYEDFYRNFYK
ncbi:MAG: tetratricopeptide repeat protein, partial [Bacteroidia bacterium]